MPVSHHAQWELPRGYTKDGREGNVLEEYVLKDLNEEEDIEEDSEQN